jgi:pimeloyl-ACP methyl ester carboxylesterase
MRKPSRFIIPTVGVALMALAVGLYLPRLSALAFIVRVAKQQGTLARLAWLAAGKVERGPIVAVGTRHGPVPTRLFRPARPARRTTLLVPGVHMDGIEEERLVGLATELAASGLQVLTVAPPDLTRYRVTPHTVDELEDVAAWAAGQTTLAPDGKVGITAFSFSGALALVAASRPSIRERIAFAFSFGGYADLPRVLRYLCGATTDPLPSPSEAQALVSGGEFIHVPRPHDYGGVVALLNLADRLVPPAQVPPLQEAITEFLRASSMDRLDSARAQEVFAHARQLGEQLAEPAHSLMKDVSDRDVDKLGEALRPVLSGLELPAALSPDRSPAPAAPVFLLHGADDSVVPASELVWLVRELQGKTRVRAFASRLVTHAEVNRGAALSEIWQLADFWRDLMAR